MGKPEEDIEERKRINLKHLAYLENFIDAYSKSRNKTQSLRELQRYRDWPDNDIKNIANKLLMIHQEYLNYTYPKEVPPGARQEITDLIKEVKKKNEPAAKSSGPLASQSRAKAVVTSQKPGAAYVAVPKAVSPDAQKELNNPYRKVRVTQLENTIKSIGEHIQKLETAHKSTAKQTYKSVKKRALSLVGKKHISKLEALKQLRLELNNIQRATENTQPVLNTAQITAHIQKSLQSANTFNKDLAPIIKEASKPYQFEARNKGDKAINELITYLNNTYGKAFTVFGEMVPDIAKKDKHNKDPFSMQTPPTNYQGPRSEMHNKDIQVGDLLAVFYPLATSGNRDQLVNDTVAEFFVQNPDHKLTALCGFFGDLNAVRQGVENITKDIGEGNSDSIPERLRIFEKSFDSLIKKQQALNIPELNDIMKKLGNIKETIEAQLPKEYQAQAKKPKA